MKIKKSAKNEVKEKETTIPSYFFFFQGAIRHKQVCWKHK